MTRINFLSRLSFIFLSMFIVSFSYANVKKAKNIPELTIYTYDSFTSEWGPGPKIKQEFEKTCQCKLKFQIFNDGISMLNRLKLEKKKSKADIILGLDNNLTHQAEQTGLLAKHKADLSNLKMPIAWKNPYFIPYDYGYFAFVYDKNIVKNPPKSLAELVKRQDLKIIYQDPRSSTPGLGLLLWMKKVFGDKSDAAWQELAQHTVTVTKGWSEAYALFLQKEADMVMSYTTSPVYHAINEKKFNYSSADFSEGHYLQVELLAKLKSSKNQALADAFIKFVLKEKFQQIILANSMYPVTNIKLPKEYSLLKVPNKALILEDAQVAAKNKQWIIQWLNAIAK